MLFDLRGRGKRRLIQAIYLMLAVLMGGGLVFFGIGGNTSGGLFDAFGGGGGGNTSNSRLEDRVKVALKRTVAAPKDPAAWAELTRARYQLAGAGANFNDAAGSFTDAGKEKLRLAGSAWERYLSLKPKPIDDNLASLMIQAYGQFGLADFNRAVRAQEVIVEARPSSNAFAQLAALAYQAGQTRKGDLAANEAIKMAPEDERNILKDRLKTAKQAGGAVPAG